MRAISVRQPWAALIVHGIKPVENRTWTTTYRGPVLIHAGKKLDIDGEIFLHENALETVGARLIDSSPEWLTYDTSGRPRGGIVGRAKLVDVVVTHPSPFFTGPFGWVFENAEPLPFHPCRGQLGLFRMEYP